MEDEKKSKYLLKKIKNNIWRYLSVIVLLLSALIIFYFILLLFLNDILFFSFNLNLDKIEKASSFLSAIGSILLIATLFISFDSINKQKKELRYQRNELKLQREELKQTRTEMSKQSDLFRLQNFQTVFFHQIEFYLRNIHKETQRIDREVKYIGNTKGEIYSIFISDIRIIKEFFDRRSQQSLEVFVEQNSNEKKWQGVFESFPNEPAAQVLYWIYDNPLIFIPRYLNVYPFKMSVMSFMYRMSELLQAHENCMSDSMRNAFLDNYLSTPDIEVVLIFYLMNISYFNSIEDSQWSYFLNEYIALNYIRNSRYDCDIFTQLYQKQ